MSHTIYKRFSPFLLLFIFFSCETEKQKTKPTLEKLVLSVYGSVIIQPEDLYHVYSESPGILEELFIEEGDKVDKGQVVAKIKSANQNLKVNSAQINAEYANENLKFNSVILTSILDEIGTIKRQIINDSLYYFKQKRLWDQGIGSKSSLDSKKLQYDLSKDKLALSQKKYVQTKLDLENKFKLSQNSLMQAKTSLKDVTIISKSEGKIYALYKNKGELIMPQEVLAQIGHRDSFYLEILIDEVDIAKVKLGQIVLVSLDAYANKIFKAKVDRIYPLKDNRTQTFKIKAKFINPPSALFAGLAGEANIITMEKNDVISIPIDYLTDGNKVLIQDGQLELKIGARNMNRVEVLAGLDTSTIILKPEVE